MKLLIVDDEQAICWGLTQLAQQHGYKVRSAASAEEALSAAASFDADIVILDICLPQMDGLTAIHHLRSELGPVPIIIMTAHGDLETAVRAVQLGAFEYVVKPFDLPAVSAILDRAKQTVQHASQTAHNVASESQGELVGKTPVMQEVFHRIALVAGSDACALITGESGTGKEVAARVIHQHGKRREGRFVAVNVAALSETLAESELFGHVRGAFTGAESDRSGLVQEADGGTLFLDEVADIPLAAQAKLLRVLEQKEVTPVGSTHAQAVDFRMISATHRDLPRMVSEGKFRHDLYFRLCSFDIHLPSLTQRRDDIPILFRHFVDQLSGEGASIRISTETLEELRLRPWYGNVRELRNAAEHALVLARDDLVLPDHLPRPAPSEMAADGGAISLDDQLSLAIHRWSQANLAKGNYNGRFYETLIGLIEQPLFEEALKQHDGQYAAAARTLGIHRTTLRKKVEPSSNEST